MAIKAVCNAQHVKCCNQSTYNKVVGCASRLIRDTRGPAANKLMVKGSQFRRSPSVSGKGEVKNGLICMQLIRARYYCKPEPNQQESDVLIVFSTQ